MALHTTPRLTLIYMTKNHPQPQNYEMLTLTFTVFCRINVPAWINTPPTFDFDWAYLRNYPTNLNHIITALDVKVFRGSHCKFHWNQTRIRFIYCLRTWRVYSAKYGILGLIYQLNCAPTLHWISQQPKMIEQCFNFLNTLPWTDESVCNIRLCLHWKKLFYKLWRLKSPLAR